ncbi:hypothetical protein T08_8343 [Trichinella sp. T8]|nr:hypothetical protein T08_8343 [Trichinella sp. T8]
MNDSQWKKEQNEPTFFLSKRDADLKFSGECMQSELPGKCVDWSDLNRSDDKRCPTVHAAAVVAAARSLFDVNAC